MSQASPAGRFPSGRWLRTPNAQALIIATIFVISILTFYILFDAASKIEYFKEILAALMGTLLTAVITTLLLKSQTSGEEIKERNVELFRRKFDAYSRFIELASLHTADRNLSKEESIQLLSMFHNMRLLSSKETSEKVFLFIEESFLEKGGPGFSMDYVLMVLKNDLFAVNESVEDSELVDTSSFVRLINTDRRMVLRHQEVVRRVLDKVVSRINGAELPVLDTVFEPSFHSDYAELSFVTQKALTVNLVMEYEILDDPECFPAFSGDIEIDPNLNKQQVIDAAKSIGFSYDGDKDKIVYVIDIKTRKKAYVCEGDMIWSVRHFCDCVIDLEGKISQSPDRSPS
jgi:hypothetical protein